MLLDWFTIGAQALNFLILVWLMKRYLYKPILNAIDAREKLIARELADAEARKAGAQKERDEFQKKNGEFDRQRAALLAKATDEANAERGRLLEAARTAADALSAKRQESLVNDARNLNQAISRLTQQEVFAIARKALTDLATVSLEERIGEVFTRRLRELDGNAKAVLGEALKKNHEPALIRSTFDLPEAQRAAIQNALNETFSADIHTRFETAPDLVSGIELSANGQKIGWSIAEYLAALQKGVGELLKEQAKPAPKPEVKTEPKPEVPKPEAKPTPKAEVKAEPKPDSAPEAKTETKPESKPKAESGTAPKEPSAVTQQIFKRVHELYEELGQIDAQAVQALEKAGQKNHEGEEKAPAEDKPKAEAASNPETTDKPKSEAKAESKPETPTPPEPAAAGPAIKSA